MANIDNFRQLDFQETGSATDSDSILIIRLDSAGKVSSALSYKISDLKIYVTADAQTKLEQIESIQADVTAKRYAVAGMQTAVSEDKTAVASMKLDVTTVQGDVQLMKNAVAEDRSAVEQLKSDNQAISDEIKKDKTEIASMKTSVESTKSAADQTKTEIAQMKTSVESSQKDVQTRHDAIKAIQSDVNNTRTEVIGIRDTMEERITTIVGSAVTGIVYINGEQYAETSRFSDKGEPFTEYVKVVGE